MIAPLTYASASLRSAPEASVLSAAACTRKAAHSASSMRMLRSGVLGLSGTALRAVGGTDLGGRVALGEVTVSDGDAIHDRRLPVGQRGALAAQLRGSTGGGVGGLLLGLAVLGVHGVPLGRCRYTIARCRYTRQDHNADSLRAADQPETDAGAAA